MSLWFRKKRISHSRSVILNEEQQWVQNEEIKSKTEPATIEIFYAGDRLESENKANEQPELAVRCSVKEKRSPNMYSECVSDANNMTTEPTSVRKALLDGDKEYWINAIKQEMTSNH